MAYVFWILLREVLAETHFIELEVNLVETKKNEICCKIHVDTKHTVSVPITNRCGEKIMFSCKIEFQLWKVMLQKV